MTNGMKEIIQALTPAVRAQAYADADMLVGFCTAHGISLGNFTLQDCKALSAKIRAGVMKASGLLNYVSLENTASTAAASFADTCQDHEKAISIQKQAVNHDVVMTGIKNFTPYNEMIRQVFLADGGNIDEFPVVEKPSPASPGAKRWEAELNSPLHYIPVMTGSSAQTIEVAASEEKIRAIRAKPVITEAEAAVLFSISPKALANKRRSKNIPRSLYRQNCENGKVYYITKEVIAYIENSSSKMKRR